MANVSPSIFVFRTDHCDLDTLCGSCVIVFSCRSSCTSSSESHSPAQVMALPQSSKSQYASNFKHQAGHVVIFSTEVLSEISLRVSNMGSASSRGFRGVVTLLHSSGRGKDSNALLHVPRHHQPKCSASACRVALSTTFHSQSTAGV